MIGSHSELATREPAGPFAPANPPPSAAPAEVHVWRLALTPDPENLNGFSRILSEDEATRAGRFRFRRDRERFVMARGGLRVVLAGYLDQAPDRIEFCYGPNGKPEIGDLVDGRRLHFNLSHSNEVGLCAVALGRRVGVDVEKVMPDRLDVGGIAEQNFGPGEIRRIQSAAPEARAEVFFRIWTRKEAYLKGRGDGITVPLSRFEVSLESPAIQPAEPGAHWGVYEVPLDAGYRGAVAVEGAAPRFRLFVPGCGMTAGRPSGSNPDP